MKLKLETLEKHNQQPNLTRFSIKNKLFKMTKEFKKIELQQNSKKTMKFLRKNISRPMV